VPGEFPILKSDAKYEELFQEGGAGDVKSGDVLEEMPEMAEVPSTSLPPGWGLGPATINPKPGMTPSPGVWNPYGKNMVGVTKKKKGKERVVI
jgi:hypothetical protein